MQGIVYQINVKPKVDGERGIPKQAVQSANLHFKGFEEDFNNYRTEKKAGTLDRAVLVLPFETITQLNREGWLVSAGDLGENITSSGIPYEGFSIGRKYSVGQSVIEISEVCKPCRFLHVLSYVGISKAPIFIATLIGRRGWYAKVIEEGMVKTHDAIREII